MKALWGSDNKEYLHDVRTVLNCSAGIRHLISRIAVGKDKTRLARTRKILLKALSDIKTINEETTL